MYILSNGYRFTLPAGMLFSRQNKNRAWSQVTIELVSSVFNLPDEQVMFFKEFE